MTAWIGYLITYFTLALFLRGTHLYLFFHGFFFAWIGARAASRWVDVRLRISRSLSTQRIFLGERLRVSLRVENPTHLPLLWAMLQDNIPRSLLTSGVHREVISLPAKSQGVLKYQIIGRKRGLYTLGPVALQTSDLLGFGQRQVEVPIQDQVVVYPRITPLHQLGLPSALPMGPFKSRVRTQQDPTWVRGARDYRPGDALRHIHWPLTATRNVLQTKELDPTVGGEGLILLDLNQREYEVHQHEHCSELAIEVAASLAHYLIGQKQGCSIWTNGQDPLRGEITPGVGIGITGQVGPGGLMQILEFLARVESRPSRSLEETIASQGVRPPWGGLCLVITPLDTPALIRASQSLVRRGARVGIIVVGDRPLHGSWVEGIRIFHAHKEVSSDDLALEE